MGLIRTEITLRNPRDRSLAPLVANALVDTGSLHLCIPAHLAIQLKLERLEEREVTTADGVKHLIINLSKVEYLDSTGLGVLIGGLKRLRESEGNLTLVGPGMRILRIFEITGLDKIFDIYGSEEEAAAKEGVSL